MPAAGGDGAQGVHVGPLRRAASGEWSERRPARGELAGEAVIGKGERELDAAETPGRRGRDARMTTTTTTTRAIIAGCGGYLTGADRPQWRSSPRRFGLGNLRRLDDRARPAFGSATSRHPAEPAFAMGTAAARAGRLSAPGLGPEITD